MEEFQDPDLDFKRIQGKQRIERLLERMNIFIGKSGDQVGVLMHTRFAELKDDVFKHIKP